MHGQIFLLLFVCKLVFKVGFVAAVRLWWFPVSWRPAANRVFPSLCVLAKGWKLPPGIQLEELTASGGSHARYDYLKCSLYRFEIFEFQVAAVEVLECDAVYSFILEADCQIALTGAGCHSESGVMIGGVECATLGHGLSFFVFVWANRLSMLTTCSSRNAWRESIGRNRGLVGNISYHMARILRFKENYSGSVHYAWLDWGPNQGDTWLGSGCWLDVLTKCMFFLSSLRAVYIVTRRLVVLHHSSSKHSLRKSLVFEHISSPARKLSWYRLVCRVIRMLCCTEGLSDS